eukprot:gene7249-11567_t
MLKMDNVKVFFYVPNLIGWGRVFCSLYSFYIYETDPKLFLLLYFLSFALDGLDGMAARFFNQSTAFGTVLDMVTDRFSTAALVSILCIFYKKYLFYLLLLNILDFTSHWYRMYCTLYTGAENHKFSDSMPNALKFYYTNKIFMAILCVGNELFYIYLYEYHFFSEFLTTSIYHQIFLYTIIPSWFLKQYMNVIQLYSSAIEIIEFENKKKLEKSQKNK